MSYTVAIYSLVVCLRSAVHYHFLSPVCSLPLLIFTPSSFSIRTSEVIYIPVKTLDNSHVIHINRNLYVTDLVRTVCDCVDYKCSEELIYDVIGHYMRKYDTNLLLEYASTRGMKDSIYMLLGTYDKYATELLENM